MTAPHILVACDLPHSIRVTRNVLGTVQETSIDGVHTRIHWPDVVMMEPLHWPRVASPSALVAVQPPDIWTHVHHTEWGTPTLLTGAHDVLAAEVTRIAFAPSLDLSDGEPDDRHDAIRPITDWLAPRLYGWVSLVIEWLEVLTQQVGSPAARSRPESQIFDGVHVWRNVRGTWTEPYKWSWSSGLQFTLDKPEWGSNAGPTEVEFALRKAASKSEPDPAYQFMRSAKAALMEGRARRALLDIGLAAELVLLPVFDQSEHPKALTNAPDRRMPPTLGAIVTALESNGTALPKALTERIVVPRNDAAHRGDVVTLDSAWAAFRTAVELFDMFAPPLD